MFGTTLQRAIFWELLRVFTLALVALISLFMLGGVYQEAAQRGLSPIQILSVMPLLIPNTIPYTVPAATLFAVCVVMGRMSHDNEITALRAAGVHQGHLLAPAVVLGIFTGIFTFFMTIEVIPRSRQLLADRLLQDVDSLLIAMLKRYGCIRHPAMNYAMYVREVRGRRLIDPIFKKRNADGTYGLVAHAKEAELWTDLANDKVCIFMPRCCASGPEQVGANFQDQTFEMPMPITAFKDSAVRPMNMTWNQILEKRVSLVEHLPVLREQIAELKKQQDANPPTPENTKYRKELENYLKNDQRTIRALGTEFHQRFVLSLGSLMFVLVAVPVGIWCGRADYLSIFVTCFLPVALTYYPLVLCGSGLSTDGVLPSYIAVWAADAVAGSVGLWLLKRLFAR